jgi:hypothetical protein
MVRHTLRLLKLELVVTEITLPSLEWGFGGVAQGIELSQGMADLSSQRRQIRNRDFLIGAERKCLGGQDTSTWE